MHSDYLIAVNVKIAVRIGHCQAGSDDDVCRPPPEYFSQLMIPKAKIATRKRQGPAGIDFFGRGRRG